MSTTVPGTEGTLMNKLTHEGVNEWNLLVIKGMHMTTIKWYFLYIKLPPNSVMETLSPGEIRWDLPCIYYLRQLLLLFSH